MEVDAFPRKYASGGVGKGLATLLKAKKAWLKNRIKQYRDLIKVASPGLTSTDPSEQDQAQAQIDDYNKEINTSMGELGKLAGPPGPAQNKVLKKNAMAWLGALQVEINYYTTAAENEAKRIEEFGKNAPGAAKAKKDDEDQAKERKQEKDDIEKDAKDAGLIP